MLSNYFLLAWRHLLKNRGYTAINIIGLATGMAVALLIGLWISDEISYDHYAPNHPRLAQTMITASGEGRYYTGNTVSMAMGPAFRDGYSDLFSRTALTCDGSSHLFGFGGKSISAPAIYAQKELPAMFGFRMLSGSIANAKDPETALISESLAAALFGKTDPIGKTIKADNEVPFRIGGVFADLPLNTTFSDVKVVMPWYNKANMYHNSSTNWGDHNGQLYVELAPNITAAQATARIRLLPTPYFKEYHEEALIYPMDRVHLYNDFDRGAPSGTGAIRYVRLFGIIGAFVLLLACINFMNLSTARSEKRAKEVGIRKTIGSLRTQLITQFLSESILVAAIAFFLSLLLTKILLPFFNDLSAKDMTLPLTSPLFWLIALAFVLFTGLLAGSYPAFYLSGFRPVQVLKGDLTRSRKRPSRRLGRSFMKAGRYAGLPRQMLVVLQFTVSLILIIGTIFVYRQIQFARSLPTGYTREGLITVGMNTPELNSHYEAVRTELIQKGLASNVGASNMTLTGFNNGNSIDWRGKTHDQDFISFRNVNVTPDYGAAIGWTILQGRDFSRAYGADTSAMILNAAAAKAIGIKNPIGEIMSLFGKKYNVIGVAANMINNNPYDSIEPAVFVGGSYTGQIIIRIRPGLATQTALADMAPIFKRYNPSSPFLYAFVDLDYAKKFASEQRIGDAASFFTVLAIFISCLGLFGLAAFVAEQRTKEIGVRKVLGAGVLSLWSLLSKEFVKLTAVSLVIAIPIAWYSMHNWLLNYPYHTPLSWWIFAAASLGILLITLLTVSFQSLKAAFMNPVKSLRSE